MIPVVTGYAERVVRLTRLRAVRERQALNQRELAEKAGLTASTLSRIEAGVQEPYSSTVRKLARALGVKPADLMAPEGDAAD
jgi:transcriptional regulator with XRE-family HTH domain